MVKACVTSFDTTPFLCKNNVLFLLFLILDPLDRGRWTENNLQKWAVTNYGGTLC